jgi:hypothetical protein
LLDQRCLKNGREARRTTRMKCPECNKVITLSKAKSIGYAKMYPQIQEDLDAGAGFKATEFDVESEFGDRLMQIMDLFGYGSKHAKMKTIIRSMIDLMPEYQSQQALTGLLLARGVAPKDVQSIAQMACRDPSMIAGSPATPPMQQPYMDPQQLHLQQLYPQQQFQQNQPPYPQQQPYPQTQPPYPQQQQPQPNVVVQQPAPQPHEDAITITEKLGEDGTVIERTIVQPKSAQADGQVQPVGVSDQLESVMQVLESHGLLKHDAGEPQGLTVDSIAELVANLPSNDNGDAIAALTASMNELKDQIAQERDDAIQNRLESLESGGSYRSGEHSDEWHKEQLSHDMRKEELGLIEKGLEKIIGPFAEMQKNASVLQTVQNLERMEAAHGVPGGTYTQLLTPTHVSDERVQGDLGRWRERAEMA